MPAGLVIPGEAIFVITGDDALERKIRQLLHHRESRTNAGAPAAVVECEDQIRRDVLRHRGSVFEELRGAIVDGLHTFSAFALHLAIGGEDARPREQRADAFEVTGVDALCVGEHQILDRHTCVGGIEL